jgi:hypothetical protein
MLYRTLVAVTVLVGSVDTAFMPALAHEVQFTEDVGATLHIEPNDIPLAGAPTEVWFALTQAGGTIIPLEACDCRLTLRDTQDSVLATPTLTPVSAEGYSNIPGTIVTFPAVGAYALVFTGTPKDGEAFSAFELRFDVTVARSAQGDQAAIESGAGTTPAAEDAEDTAAQEKPRTTEPAPPHSTNTAADSTVAQLSETSRTSSASRAWYLPLIFGGALLTAGIVWRVMHGSRSPGDKS